jgi:WXG100 family type VII secretion target
MAESWGFGVDLDLLDETVGEMAHCGEELDVLLDEVAQRVAALHVTWAGAAALAQDGAQAEWEAGFRRMREALASMRTAGGVAHGNYLDAATTNLRMWEQVS